jgi:hypothetical protein
VVNEGPPWDPGQARNRVGIGNLRRHLQFMEGASFSLPQEGGVPIAEVRLAKEADHVV